MGFDNWNSEWQLELSTDGVFSLVVGPASRAHTDTGTALEAISEYP